jgi:hypothetical protein
MPIALDQYIVFQDGTVASNRCGKEYQNFQKHEFSWQNKRGSKMIIGGFLKQDQTSDQSTTKRCA